MIRFIYSLWTSVLETGSFTFMFLLESPYDVVFYCGKFPGSLLHCWQYFFFFETSWQYNWRACLSVLESHLILQYWRVKVFFVDGCSKESQEICKQLPYTYCYLAIQFLYFSFCLFSFTVLSIFIFNNGITKWWYFNNGITKWWHPLLFWCKESPKFPPLSFLNLQELQKHGGPDMTMALDGNKADLHENRNLLRYANKILPPSLKKKLA